MAMLTGNSCCNIDKNSLEIVYESASVPDDEKLESVKKLILAGVNVNFKDSKTGKTPLHCAVEGHNFSVFTELLKAGANLHVKDHSGTSPLDLVFRLVKSGREQSQLSNGYWNFEYNKKLLEKASQQYSVDSKIVSQLLMQFDFDSTVQQPVTLQSLLHWAVEIENIEAIKVLIDVNSDILTLTNSENQTALQLAQKLYIDQNNNSSNHHTIVQWLQSGAMPRNSNRVKNLTIVQQQCAKSFLNSTATVLNLERYRTWQTDFGMIEIDTEDCKLYQDIADFFSFEHPLFEKVIVSQGDYLTFLSQTITIWHSKRNSNLSLQEIQVMPKKLRDELFDKLDELIDQLLGILKLPFETLPKVIYLYTLISSATRMMVKSRNFYRLLLIYKRDFTKSVIKQYLPEWQAEMKGIDNNRSSNSSMNSFFTTSEELFAQMEKSMHNFVEQFKREVNNCVGKIIGQNCCPWNSKGFAQFVDQYYPLTKTTDSGITQKMSESIQRAWLERTVSYLEECKNKFATDLIRVSKTYRNTCDIISDTCDNSKTRSLACVLAPDVVTSAQELYNQILEELSKLCVPSHGLAGIICGNQIVIYAAATNAAKSILKWLHNTDSVVATRILQLRNELQQIQHIETQPQDNKSDFEVVKLQEKQMIKQIQKNERATTQLKQAEFERAEKRHEIEANLSQLREEENTHWRNKLLDRLRESKISRTILHNILQGSHLIKTRDVLLLVQQLQIPGSEAIHNDCSGCKDNKLSLKLGNIGKCGLHIRHDRDRDDYLDESFLRQFRSIIQSIGITIEMLQRVISNNNNSN